MNSIVFVGFTLPSFNPLANLPNSFADDVDHIFCILGVASVVGSSGTCSFPHRKSVVPVWWFLWIVCGACYVEGCVPLTLLQDNF
jgi:hypothetical protein